MILCKLNIKWQKMLAKGKGHDKQSGHNKLSDKDEEDVNLSYEQNKNTDVLDAQEHHSTYGLEHEDQGKGEYKGNEHLLVSRSITYQDDSQEALIKKRECMEPEHIVATWEVENQ